MSGETVDAASKAALDTLTLASAKEWAAEGIGVNALYPGLIQTAIHASPGRQGLLDKLGPQIPLDRVGSPGEVA